MPPTDVVHATPALSTSPKAPRTREPTATGSRGSPIRGRRCSGVVSRPIGSAGFLVASSQSCNDFALTCARWWADMAESRLWRTETYGGGHRHGVRGQDPSQVSQIDPATAPSPLGTPPCAPILHMLTPPSARAQVWQLCSSVRDDGRCTDVPTPTLHAWTTILDGWTLQTTKNCACLCVCCVYH